MNDDNDVDEMLGAAVGGPRFLTLFNRHFHNNKILPSFLYAEKKLSKEKSFRIRRDTNMYRVKNIFLKKEKNVDFKPVELSLGIVDLQTRPLPSKKHACKTASSEELDIRAPSMSSTWVAQR
jgi:hypothetical protein